ncbi:MAG: DNA mismatch repair protein MutS, partial [Maribacter dokdonensis]|uniref:DNA mismatch repair protein MutS n=1 Tax=Maribacter dokdonensis TaxID=320912 RepID=UPI003298087A
MNNLQEFYTTKVNGFEKQIEALNKQLFTFSILRLLIFLGTIVAIYFASVDAKYVIGVLCVGIPLFLYLVSKYTNLKHQKSKLEALKEINAVELQVLNRDYSNLPNGKEYADDIHYFSQDIDLFGEGSFYQVSNRTKLAEGSLLLADIYKENSINEIKEKQEAIAEIAEKVDWRQEFSAMAALTKTETSTRTIATWLKNYKSFVPKAMKFIPSVFSIFSVTIFIAYFLDYLPESVLITWLVLGMVIVGLFTKKVTNLGQSASKMKSTFDQYNQLLAMIEETEFTSNLLKRQKANILSNGEQNSKVLKKFASLLSNLDRNNNLLYLIFANGFLLRSLTDCLAVEKWIEEHGKSVETWFNTIAFFDAYNSLGNFAFNHPNFTYPTITDDEVVLNSKNAGHPLLDPKKSILNDITIEGGQFFIITGANMAGKSTFL